MPWNIPPLHSVVNCFPHSRLCITVLSVSILLIVSESHIVSSHWVELLPLNNCIEIHLSCYVYSIASICSLFIFEKCLYGISLFVYTTIALFILQINNIEIFFSLQTGDLKNISINFWAKDFHIHEFLISFS